MDVVAPLLAWRRWLALGAAALAGVLTLQAGGGSAVDEAIAAARGGFRLHPASGEVHIIEIDERSIAAVARWPWPRGAHAEAVERLHALGARSIAFDVDFSSPAEPAQDAKFAAALEKVGRTVILPTFRQYAGAASGAEIEAAPLPAFASRAFLAAANVQPDEDGRLRHMLYGLEIAGAPRPSLASMLAERTGLAGRSFAIDTAIDPATIPRHSLIDVLRGRVPASALRGKRAIIGGTAVELGDRYPVPRHGILPGVVAQAMAAETLLNGEPPIERSGAWALALALVLAAGAILPKGRRSRRAALFAAGSAAILMLPLADRTIGTFLLGPAAAALAAAAAAGGSAWLALRHRETRLEDPVTRLPNLLALERQASARPNATIAVARIDRFGSLVSALGTDAAAALVRSLADRLRFAAGAPAIYRVDDSSLAWLDSAETPLADRIEGVYALMRAPLGAGAPDVRLHFGAARGSGAQARQLAADAGLAASHAAAADDRFRFFTEADGESVSRGVALLSGFSAALAAGRVWNAYQPKFDLVSGEVTAVEALVRWEHETLGSLAPDAFVPLLEQNGRAAELALHVLSRALADAAGWGAAAPPLGVAVNLSASLLHDETEMELFLAAVRASGLPPERLTVEVTETAAMAHPERAIRALERFRSLGLGVSIDDYGTGQSSLSYLQTLPATELKIDKSFVASIADEPRNAIMVRSTIAMAHELGLKVVAEGVEDEKCLERLREMGCDMVQGWLIARPMPAAEVPAFRPRLAGVRALEAKAG